MRMKLFLTLFTVGVILLAGCLPQLFLSSLCSVQYIRPVEQPYSRRLSCEGVVRAQKSAEVYLDTPVIPMEVPVSVGDWVGEGDSLAVIDVSLTQTVLAHSGAVSVEKEAKAAFPSSWKIYMPWRKVIRSAGIRWMPSPRATPLATSSPPRLR